MCRIILMIMAFVLSNKATFAQSKILQYKVHQLKITEKDKKFSDGSIDFGYNYTQSSQDNFIKNGYYIWIQDQWYYVKNAKDIFKSNEITPLLFEALVDNKTVLNIEDSEGIGYTYPIESISTYVISKNHYDNWVKNAQSLVFPTEKIGEKTSVGPENKQNLANNEKKDTNKQEKIQGVLIDVVSISEEIVEKTIPYTLPKDKNNEKQAETENEKKESVEKTVSDIAQNEKQEKEENKKYPNLYEKAVAEGFDGTISEWIEMVDNKGGKSAYEQSVEYGFKGSKAEWIRSLYGSNTAPEIDKKERDTYYVMEWLKELNSKDGYTPYETALKNGFYGTFTEWVESVIGLDGEAIYNREVKKGYKGTYREWVESKLNEANEEMKRKDLLKNTSFVLIPNIQIDIPEGNKVLELNLYNHYDKYYGASVFSSNKTNTQVKINPTDIEYQITWFNTEDIKIIEISDKGIMKYKRNNSNRKKTDINVRYLFK